MIEGVMDKSEIDAMAEKFGGRFKLTVLIQKRVKELVKGAARLVETDHKNLIDVALEEIRQGTLQWEGMLDDEPERKPRKKD
jgi:DNA-directed RNA polymerase subunit K/omega